MSQDPAEPVLTGTLIVDAIEGRYARVEREDGARENWTLASLPCGVQEGDVIRLHVEGGDLEMDIDREATRRRRKQAQSQLNALNKADRAGKIDL